MVYLQGGWYDFFLRGMLADYAALRAAGRVVRLLIGPWTHGRGLYTRHREVPEHLAGGLLRVRHRRGDSGVDALRGAP
jgi:predicted acyl esterase